MRIEIEYTSDELVKGEEAVEAVARKLGVTHDEDPTKRFGAIRDLVSQASSFRRAEMEALLKEVDAVLDVG